MGLGAHMFFSPFFNRLCEWSWSVACVVQGLEQSVQKYCIISHDSTNIFDENLVHNELVYTENASFKDF